MPVINRIGAVIAFALISVASQATELENGFNTLPITLQTLLESTGRENVVNLTQLGVLNHTYLSQAGEGNVTNLLQMGSSNKAQIMQYGQDNDVELMQTGVDNQANITQIGNDNLVHLNQLGSASFSIEQIADGAAITITQY